MKRALILLWSCVLCASGAVAQEKKKSWTFSSEESYVNTNGNSDAETFSSKNRFEREWSVFALRTRAEALGSRDDEGTTAENYLAEEKFEWLFEKPNYLFELGRWEKDRFAGIDSRTTAGGGFGRQIIKSARQELTAELGGQVSWEDRRDGPAESFGSGRAFARYLLHLSSNSQFSQDLEYLRDFDVSDAYRVNSITALQSLINNHLALKASYEIKFDNEPPPGIRKTDTITSIALVIKL